MKLLGSSILKLAVVMVTFLAYGLGSLYFNYYIYTFSESTSEFFDKLSKQNYYIIGLASITRHVATTGQKYLLGKSHGILLRRD